MNDWNKVQDIFLEAVDMPFADRKLFLQTACGADDQLLMEVESLLAADHDSGTYLQEMVQDEAARIFDSGVLVGERLGMYRIVREIGRGGMGWVYLALRDDAEYNKEVAIKTIKRGMDTEDILARFRFERQVLANLEHPYIARLFDGGSTAEGLPFLVMEYVAGVPLDAFCRERSPDVRAKCDLFLRILEGVSYAHRNLIIHRDLKPANILITAEGIPKLLDFGVAKLLDPGQDVQHTRDALYRPFTPGYASPEQVRALPMSTATDVYSLGAIFYEMLTGTQAQQFNSLTPQEIERVICETRAPLKTLAGVPTDLLTIAQMAMHKEPARRYATAEQFAEDIRRYLENRPVTARRDSTWYRARKFLVRNKLQTAATAIATLSLLVGLAISLQQTQRAHKALAVAEAQRQIAVQQRQIAIDETKAAETARNNEAAQRVIADSQRDEAQKQREIADQRVQDLQDLSNRTLFDVHDAIAPLPGAVAARQTLVQTTLDYLNKLEQQAGLDDQMRRTLSAAYYKVALLQGAPENPSLQNVHDAEASLQKAQTLLEPLYRTHPNDAELLFRWIQIRSNIAELMYRSDRRAQGIALQQSLLPLANRLAQMQPASKQYSGLRVELESRLSTELLTVDMKQALEHALTGITLSRILVARFPDDNSIRQTYDSLLASGAAAYGTMGNLQQSATLYRESIAAREVLMQHDPNNSSLRRNLMVAYGNYATMLGVPWSPNLNRPEEARQYAEKGVALARETVAKDKNDITARYDLGMVLSRLGMVDPAKDGAAQSLASLEEAQSLIEPVARANARSSASAGHLAIVLEYEGHRLETLGRTGDAQAAYRKSIQVLKPFIGQHNQTVNSQTLVDEESLAVLQAGLGEKQTALDTANGAVRQAQEYATEPPMTDSKTEMLAQAWSALALVESRLGMQAEAGVSARKAMSGWQTIQSPGTLTAHREILEQIRGLLTAQ